MVSALGSRVAFPWPKISHFQKEFYIKPLSIRPKIIFKIPGPGAGVGAPRLINPPRLMEPPGWEVLGGTRGTGRYWEVLK